MNRILRKGLLPVAAVAIGLACSMSAPTAFAQATAAPTTASVTVAATAKPGMPKVKVKAAFVDVERCVGETEDGLRAKATLKKISDRKQMYVTQVEDRLKRDQEELADLAKNGQTTELSKKVLAYQNELQKYNDLIKRINNELAIREDDLLAPIEKDIKAIFTRLAEENGYDMIFDKKIMLVNTHPELDLTEQVIREYNWRNNKGVGAAPSGSGSAGPAPSAKASSTVFVAPL